MSDGPTADPVAGTAPLRVTEAGVTRLAWFVCLAAVTAGFPMVLVFTLLAPAARVAAH